MLVGGGAHVDQGVALDFESQGVLPVSIDSHVLRERRLLDESQSGGEQQVVVVRLLKQFP